MIGKFNTILLYLVITLIAGTVLGAVKQPESLRQRPLDEDDAENVRIWLDLERPNRCRTEVVIVNSTSDTVRHLFSRLLSRGIYNFYWDKKNDSGQFVDTGKYRYFAFDCGRIHDGKLFIKYTEWERYFSLSVATFEKDKTIYLTLAQDSALVTIDFLNRRSVSVDRPIVDSVFRVGEHRIVWSPSKKQSSGFYTIHITIGDFSVERKVRYRK